MAYSFLQNNKNGASGSNSSNFNIAYTSACTNGSLLLASVDNATNNVQPTVSDGTNGTWTLLNSAARSTSQSLYLFGVINTATTALTVTVAPNTTSNRIVALYELSGGPASITGIVDVSGSATSASSGTATTTSTHQPSITTTNAADLVFTSVGTAAAITSPSVTDPGGFTYTLQQQSITGSIRLTDASSIMTSTGTTNPNFSWTTTSNWVQLTTALFPVATGTTPPSTALSLLGVG